MLEGNTTSIFTSLCQQYHNISDGFIPGCNFPLNSETSCLTTYGDSLTNYQTACLVYFLVGLFIFLISSVVTLQLYIIRNYRDEPTSMLSEKISRATSVCSFFNCLNSIDVGGYNNSLPYSFTLYFAGACFFSVSFIAIFSIYKWIGFLTQQGMLKEEPKVSERAMSDDARENPKQNLTPPTLSLVAVLEANKVFEFIFDLHFRSVHLLHLRAGPKPQYRRLHLRRCFEQYVAQNKGTFYCYDLRRKYNSWPFLCPRCGN